MSTDSSNPNSYELEVLTIVNNEGEGFDIRNIFIECNIYESIHRNFLMGELIIADAVGFMETAKLFGQESLRIRFKQPTGFYDETEEEESIDQIFRIYKIQGTTRVHRATEAVQLSFCSPEFIEAKRTRISQALRGSMTDIAVGLAKKHLGISNEEDKDTKLEPYFEVREASQGDNYHVVIPNWTVNYTINWLCAQAQGIDSNSGIQDSFFWFQTANGGYRIESLTSMLKTDYSLKPFVWMEAGSVSDGKNLTYDSEDPSLGMGKRILEYKVNNHANVLEGIVNGLFGSNQLTINNTHKFYQEKSYNFLEKFVDGKDNHIEGFPFVRIKPETLYIGSAVEVDEGEEEVKILGNQLGKSIGSYPDACRTLTSDSYFVNDENNTIHQANHQAHLGANQNRDAVRQLLQYHTISLVISARTDISCGQLINLDIPVPDGTEELVNSKFYNGRHLITDIKWRLQPTTCVLNIKCMKESVMTPIDIATAV